MTVVGMNVASSFRRRKAARISLIDIISSVMLIYPIYWLFYPLESYLDMTLPIPVTSITLVLISLWVIFLYFQCVRQKPFVHSFPAYIFVLSAFMSIIWSPDPQLTFQRALRLLPAVGLGLTLAQYYSMNRLLKLMTISFLIAGVISVVVSVAFPSIGLSRIGGGYESAWRGAHVHKNFMGPAFALGVIVSGYTTWMKLVSPRIGVACVLICLLLVAMSQSATAMVAMVAALSFAPPLFLLRRFPVILRPTLIIAVLALSVGAAMFLILNIDTVVGFTGRDLTFTGRTEIWAAVWDRIQASPILGYYYGFWTMEDNSEKQWIWDYVGDTAAHSHNTWLDVWLQLGITGLVSILVLVGITINNLIYFLVQSSRKEFMLYTTIFMFIMVRSFTEVQFTDPVNFGLFWAVLISSWLQQDYRRAHAAMARREMPRRHHRHIAKRLPI